MKHKHGFFKYYTRIPVRIFNTAMYALKYLLGRWWCDKCSMYHSRRIVKYFIIAPGISGNKRISNAMCSKHVREDKLHYESE